ncbi:MAG: hypothetical protein LC679_07585 [Intrasporangiaceae bacterium]|nr:hypothetical protein [Intrasporangiaceae bacterium]
MTWLEDAPVNRTLAHNPDVCTYTCPYTGDEVLTFRDVRHVVVDAEQWRAMLDALEAAEVLVLSGEPQSVKALAADALSDALDRVRDLMEANRDRRRHSSD